MSIIGGDITEIQYNHPTVGSGTFFVKADEDSEFDPGGVRTDDDDSSVAGNGAMIRKMTRSRWSFSGPIAWDMSGANELDVLRQLSSDPVDAEFTLTHINGSVWGGNGSPVGDIKGSTKDASIPIKLAGGNLLEKTSG